LYTRGICISFSAISLNGCLAVFALDNESFGRFRIDQIDSFISYKVDIIRANALSFHPIWFTRLDFTSMWCKVPYSISPLLLSFFFNSTSSESTLVFVQQVLIAAKPLFCKSSSSFVDVKRLSIYTWYKYFIAGNCSSKYTITACVLFPLFLVFVLPSFTGVLTPIGPFFCPGQC